MCANHPLAISLDARFRRAVVIFAALGVLVAADREAHARPTEFLLSNEGPPPSARLLLVNLTQRHVAQEFTTGSHRGGYDIYAVAVRTETSDGKEDMGLHGRVRSRRWEPVGSLPANAFGVHDMVGNVYEWVEDCGLYSYEGTPSDGSAVEPDAACRRRMMRGGSWLSLPRASRPANRVRNPAGFSDINVGFRVVRVLP